ncbi:helix-turn-helix domain-containing protein [Membranihabitans maritimus]|uniref:helix-turn-helix domain-containing protein n=1 Tax=Membranihabitans maritimus TaxID=2904244 RepID=UPI001F279F4D|nr:helix-turn-helix transcriptional regulator [Membranihabitans maritimus]
MKEIIQIPQLHLYIINRVRYIRLELGLSQRDVSRILYPESSSNLLGGIEGSARPNSYTDENLNKLAKAFTEISKQQGNYMEYTMKDFYPPEPLPEKMVKKEVIEIPEYLGPTGILNVLLEKGDAFFNDWHSVKEITEYCNRYAIQNWRTSHFTAIIARAEERKKLIRLSENEALYKKL